MNEDEVSCGNETNKKALSLQPQGFSSVSDFKLIYFNGVSMFAQKKSNRAIEQIGRGSGWTAFNPGLFWKMLILTLQPKYFIVLSAGLWFYFYPLSKRRRSNPMRQSHDTEIKRTFFFKHFSCWNREYEACTLYWTIPPAMEKGMRNGFPGWAKKGPDWWAS